MKRNNIISYRINVIYLKGLLHVVTSQPALSETPKERQKTQKSKREAHEHLKAHLFGTSSLSNNDGNQENTNTDDNNSARSRGSITSITSTHSNISQNNSSNVNSNINNNNNISSTINNNAVIGGTSNVSAMNQRLRNRRALFGNIDSVGYLYIHIYIYIYYCNPIKYDMMNVRPL